MFNVTSYDVRIDGESAVVELESDTTPNELGGSRIARINFGPGFEPGAFINRGGFLSISRPLGLPTPLAPRGCAQRYDTPTWTSAKGHGWSHDA